MHEYPYRCYAILRLYATGSSLTSVYHSNFRSPRVSDHHGVIRLILRQPSQDEIPSAWARAAGDKPADQHHLCSARVDLVPLAAILASRPPYDLHRC